LAVIVIVWVWFESPSVHVGLHDDGDGVRVMAGEPLLAKNHPAQATDGSRRTAAIIGRYLFITSPPSTGS
jgi:hypothetical protein